jgi:hypothetical protein
MPYTSEPAAQTDEYGDVNKFKYNSEKQLAVSISCLSPGVIATPVEGKARTNLSIS